MEKWCSRGKWAIWYKKLIVYGNVDGLYIKGDMYWH